MSDIQAIADAVDLLRDIAANLGAVELLPPLGLERLSAVAATLCRCTTELEELAVVAKLRAIVGADDHALSADQGASDQEGRGRSKR